MNGGSDERALQRLADAEDKFDVQLKNVLERERERRSDEERKKCDVFVLPQWFF